MEFVIVHSYCREPDGIPSYKTLKGFSMEDCSAARGSEIILRVYELKIYHDLSLYKLLRTVSRYLWFRDDVSVILV